MPPNNLLHIATGGTIDSDWDGAQDTAVPRRESFIPGYLREAVRLPDFTSRTLFLRDSRSIKLNDQDLIADSVMETSHQRVVLTIGTYLMADVSRVICEHPMAKNFEMMDRRVVLTGSVIPMDGFLKSDGGFNLGMSMAVLENETVNRVSLVMNGLCLNGASVRKDLSSATFSGFDRGSDQLGLRDFDLITIGGSIDFLPNGLDGMSPGGASKVPSYLRDSVRMTNQIWAVNPFVKDSRDLSPADYEMIGNMIRGAKTKHILITTGIYRLPQIAAYIEKNINTEEAGLSIILTGSRIPLGVTDMSDAPFNLGYAVGKFASMKPGVSILLNGRTFKREEDVVGAVFTPAEVAQLKDMLK